MADNRRIPWSSAVGPRRRMRHTPRRASTLRPRAARFSATAGAHLLPSRRAGEGGFTLIELLVVVIILGLLAALVGPRLLGRVGQSKQAAARVQIELLGAALDQFKLDAGRYPTTQEGLQALQTNPGNVSGWEGPYLKKEVPRDPWGNAYHYKSPGDHGEYDAWSYGADNAPGGTGEAGDTTSWGGEGKSE